MRGLSSKSATHAQEILERGFTVFDQAYDQAWVDAVRRDIVTHYEGLGRPALWSRDSQQIADDVVICMAGLTVHGLLPRFPEHSSTLLKPDIVDAFRQVLGEDMHMEVAGWVIADKQRPFFDWHIHAYGLDDSYFLRRGYWPKIDSAQRVMALLYLDDLEPDHGPLLVHPHRVGDPVDPPHDRGEENWAGQVELGVKRGTLVAIEQCTWHAVRKQLADGPRIWICMTFSARDTPRCGWFDDRLLTHQTDDPLLRSVLPTIKPPLPPESPGRAAF